MVVNVARRAREDAREDVRRQILAHARGQLAVAGPGELSLRAIARDLGMVPSGIYRYLANRDELITALLVQVYNELGDVLEAADGAVERRSAYTARFVALSDALRDWAVAHPFDWALLYGSPVPGYSAPQDTVPPAARTTGAFTAVLVDATLDGAVPSAVAAMAPEATASISGLLEMLPVPVDAGLMLRGTVAWSGVMGAISLELFGHLKGAVVDSEAWFAGVVQQQAGLLGLP
jgi:AcrR family transcriptional regulator